MNAWWLAADDDALFASFLQAGQARVLLPVQPAHVMAFLYFYSAGMLWSLSRKWLPTADCSTLSRLASSTYLRSTMVSRP